VSIMEDSTKNTLIAVGVGVGTVSLLGTAMYFLGGREAPKVPSLGELEALGKREFLFGSDTETEKTALGGFSVEQTAHLAYLQRQERIDNIIKKLYKRLYTLQNQSVGAKKKSPIREKAIQDIKDEINAFYALRAGKAQTDPIFDPIFDGE